MAKVRYDTKGRILPQGMTEVGENKYKLRFMYHGRKYCETVEGYTKAKRALEDMKFKGRRNLLEEDTLTLNEWFDTCLELKKIQITTKEQYQGTWDKWLRNTLGKKKPGDITRLEVKQFFTGMAKKVGKSRVEATYILLNNTLEEALCDKPMKSNPCVNILKNIEFKKTENERQKALTELQQEQFLKYLHLINDPYLDFYVVMFNTGMRISELAALYEEDVDFENGFIHVNKALKHTKSGYVIGSPKHGSKRVIPMLPVVEKILKKRVDMLHDPAQKLPRRKNENVLFYALKTGNYILSNSMIKHTDKVLEEIPGEMRGFTNHAMRHSFATRLMENNVNENYIALTLGHKDVSTTRKSYVDLEVDQEKLKQNILKSEITEKLGKDV